MRWLAQEFGRLVAWLLVIMFVGAIAGFVLALVIGVGFWAALLWAAVGAVLLPVGLLALRSAMDI